MAVAAKPAASLWTIIAKIEVSHVDDKAQAGECARDSGRGVHGANAPDTGGSGGGQRKHVNELCNDRRAITTRTALILARVFGNSPDFWLNVQGRNDLWVATHSPRERKRIERAKPVKATA